MFRYELKLNKTKFFIIKLKTLGEGWQTVMKTDKSNECKKKVKFSKIILFKFLSKRNSN